MKTAITCFLLCIVLATYAQHEISIIPEPVKITKGDGYFVLPREISISLPADNSLAPALKSVSNKIETATGSSVKKVPGAAIITLQINKTPDAPIGNEGYVLNITPNRIIITANQPAGLFYGLQSLLQLLPPQIESKEPVSGVEWKLPVVNIIDYPRVGWRGLMFDVSRHFFTKEEVERYIDDMARYKFNMLHWHLTDDEGWRIEIKSLPNLTKTGAWRVNKTGSFGSFSKPGPDEPKDYGGFYTQEDIKEIIQYAKDRFVQVMPEIDVPGHSLAAIASYPELSCTPGADQYQVRAGEAIMDWSHGAPPIALIDNTLCPANEKVYGFLDKVMTEVAQLFPFEYIHVGGDEAPHNFWEQHPQVQALMKKEKLTTIPQVQAYFEKRLEKIVNAKGKKMMAWDEVLEGGVAPSTGVMSWRGVNYGVEASNKGHYVVMSPTDYAYIDYMQADVSTEPRVYASLRLNKTYQFDPVPAGANGKYILGGQANLWTEQIYNLRQAQYMTWPRGFAISESVWSPADKKDWKHFVAKTEAQFERLDYAETKYSPAIYDPVVTVKKDDNNNYWVTLTPEIDGLDVYYSFDNSSPDRFYPKYNEPLKIPTDASLMRIISYKGKQPAGRLMTITVDDLKQRVK
ncbi:MAG: family 20 glycosylhydrolase [Niabella sp.]